MMRSQKLVALLALAVLVGLALALRLLDRRVSQFRALDYSGRGMVFYLDRRGIVEQVMLFPTEGFEEKEADGPESWTTIHPGRGVGDVRFGDPESEVREKWPLQWRRYGEGEFSIIYDDRGSVSCSFQDDRLEFVSISGHEYKTAENIGPGSPEVEVIAAYGEPDELPAYAGKKTTIFTEAAGKMEQSLVLAGLLAFLAVKVIKVEGPSRLFWILIAGYLFLLVITINPIRVIQFGFGYLGFYLRSIRNFALFYVLGALVAPLMLAGIWWGERIACRKGFGGAGKYILPGSFVFLGNAVFYILMAVGAGLYFGMRFGDPMTQSRILFQIPLALTGVVFYLAFLQFARLFGSGSNCPIYSPDGIQGCR